MGAFERLDTFDDAVAASSTSEVPGLAEREGGPADETCREPFVSDGAGSSLLSRV